VAASSASAAGRHAPDASHRNLGAPPLFSRGMVRRLAIAAALPLAALVAVTAAPAASAVVTLAAAPATVKLVDCSRDAHSAGFHGRMKRIEGSERMWMRFTLLEKRAAGFEVLAAPGLGRWQKSKPGVGAFGYRQTVRGLQPGASYRMQVDYRWYSADKQLAARAQRRSAACRQFERLPNLTASVVGARTTKVEGVLRYGVQVQNSGVAAASGVAVRMAVDGGVLDTVMVASLRPGESRLLAFRGPACTTSVSAAVDPDGVLVESAEDDNFQEVPCADLPQP
jgi:CARDB